MARVPAGTVVFSEGEVGTEMYVIQSGTVEVFKKTTRGDEKFLATLEKGDFFGEMSILEDVPRTATARAKTDCELLKINQSTFDEMLRHNGEIAVRMLRKLSRRLRETTKLLEQSTGVAPALDDASDILAKEGERHEIYRLDDGRGRGVLPEPRGGDDDRADRPRHRHPARHRPREPRHAALRLAPPREDREHRLRVPGRRGDRDDERHVRQRPADPDGAARHDQGRRPDPLRPRRHVFRVKQELGPPHPALSLRPADARSAA